MMSLSQPQPDRQAPSDWQPRRTTRPLSQRLDTAGKENKRGEVAPEAKAGAKTLKDFWTKISNDWVFNLSAMLAYNLLMSIVPLLAMFLSIFGLVLGGMAPGVQQNFINGVAGGIPGGGQEFIKAALNRLAASSGVFAIITILVSAWFGSRLFVAIDQCFGIIFRLPSRKFLRQNAVALGMLFIFAVLIPVLLAVSAAPSFLSTTVINRLLGQSTASAILLAIVSVLAGYIIASVLFLAIYTILPNRPLRVKDAWVGALVAGALLQVYSVAFPFYAAQFLKPENYGSTAGFAVLILVFFYYFGIILLLGAEINSFWMGQRQTATSLPGILYEVQVRASAEGAAGPTAGQLQENIQADRTGPDFAMTPAEDVLEPPGPKEPSERQGEQAQGEQKKQEPAKEETITG
jgi:membrane protein